MSTLGDVHVHDIGTHYQAKIQDAGAPFDPSIATTKQFYFWTPAGVLTRTASVTTDGTNWYLNYTVIPGTDDAFHAQAGVYQWQGRLVFPDGQVYWTNVESYVVQRNIA